jgi:hypothetical protein
VQRHSTNTVRKRKGARVHQVWSPEIVVSSVVEAFQHNSHFSCSEPVSDEPQPWQAASLAKVQVALVPVRVTVTSDVALCDSASRIQQRGSVESRRTSDLEQSPNCNPQLHHPQPCLCPSAVLHSQANGKQMPTTSRHAAPERECREQETSESRVPTAILSCTIHNHVCALAALCSTHKRIGN